MSNRKKAPFPISGGNYAHVNGKLVRTDVKPPAPPAKPERPVGDVDGNVAPANHGRPKK